MSHSPDFEEHSALPQHLLAAIWPAIERARLEIAARRHEQETSRTCHLRDAMGRGTERAADASLSISKAIDALPTASRPDP